MEKIKFENLPSTKTPLSAENLNLLQANFEEEINRIIESGSNENGNWIKFSDGTMICYTWVQGTYAITNTWGSLFYYNLEIGKTPQVFTDIPSVIIQSSGPEMCLVAGFGADKNSFGGANLVLPFKATTFYRISAVAIGRWKNDN